MEYKVPHFINGIKIMGSGRELPIYNPAQGTVIGKVTVADSKIVDNAVQAAKSAFQTWGETTPTQRAKIIFQFKALLDQHIKELAMLVTNEHGKTIAEAMGSVQRGIDVVNYACGIAGHLSGKFSENVSSEMDSYSLRQPVGVCAGITPFNFPAMIPLWMFPMAIACGNTFILKPSEKDPSCALRLVELAQQAGLPNGVVNLVQGDKETVDAILSHPDIQAISFVGSSAVAEKVHEQAVLQNKRVQAFGGAKNHCVVMPDANMIEAAQAIVTSAYGSAGERCMAISAVIAVGDATADMLIGAMLPLIKAIKIGAGTEDNVTMGPLITQEHWQRVKSYVELGLQEGAVLLMDGSDYKPANKDGFFMGACLFDQVKPSMRIYREEIFGPVLVILRVKNYQEALALVNDHEYGNGTAIFTADGYTARMFVEKVQVGMVGVNVPVPVPVAYHSFGGWKRSIFSDIGMYGQEAVHFYTKLKTVTQRWFAGEKV